MLLRVFNSCKFLTTDVTTVRFECIVYGALVSHHVRPVICFITALSALKSSTIRIHTLLKWHKILRSKQLHSIFLHSNGYNGLEFLHSTRNHDINCFLQKPSNVFLFELPIPIRYFIFYGIVIGIYYSALLRIGSKFGTGKNCPK